MIASSTFPNTDRTLTDILERFGPIPFRRIRHDPTPGAATEKDVIDIYNREQRLYELVDGILVEKAMGFKESAIAMVLAYHLRAFLEKHRLGTVAGEAGMLRLASGLIRIPDVSFVSWDKFPNRRLPDAAAPALVPDLAVEVLSPANTEREMEQKLSDYFTAGVRIVWTVDPEERRVRVFRSPTESVTLRKGESLDGGDVLPGFLLPLQDLFAELDRQ